MKLEDYKRVIYKYKTETKIPIVIVGNKSDDKFGRQVRFQVTFQSYDHHHLTYPVSGFL